MKLRYLPRAYADIERLHAFLRHKDVAAADRAVDLIYESARSLKTAPGKGRPLSKGVRELIVRFGQGAYILRYRIDHASDAIIIARVRHSREHG